MNSINKASILSKALYVQDISIYIEQEKEKLQKEILRRAIEARIKEYGPNCDLNDLDVSSVTDMSSLFAWSEFNGDISNWDVSNVKDTGSMFYKSKFNGDISRWNTSNVRNMRYMFGCSKFNEDISKWDVSNVENMSNMFCESKFNGDISKWNVSRVRNMSYMFAHSDFEQNLSNWTIVPGTLTVCMLQRDTPHDIPFPPRFRPKGLKRDAY